MILWWVVLLGVMMIVFSIIGIVWIHLLRSEELSVLFMAGIMFVLIGFAWSTLVGDPNDRLEVRIVNEMGDPVHVNVTFNGAMKINSNMAPPQWWFNGDDDNTIFLHQDDIGSEPGILSVSLNGATPIVLKGEWGLGDALKIMINSDASVTVIGNGELLQ